MRYLPISFFKNLIEKDIHGELDHLNSHGKSLLPFTGEFRKDEGMK